MCERISHLPAAVDSSHWIGFFWAWECSRHPCCSSITDWLSYHVFVLWYSMHNLLVVCTWRFTLTLLYFPPLTFSHQHCTQSSRSRSCLLSCSVMLVMGSSWHCLHWSSSFLRRESQQYLPREEERWVLLYAILVLLNHWMYCTLIVNVHINRWFCLCIVLQIWCYHGLIARRYHRYYRLTYPGLETEQ